MFELQSETITVRGQQLVVTELSQRKKALWAKAVMEDRFSAPYVLVSLCVSPAVTPEQANDWPSSIVETVVEVARRLSGMKDDPAADEKKD